MRTNLTRRRLLKAAVTLPLMALPRVPGVATHPAVPILTTRVAGFRFHAGDRALTGISSGSSLVLHREPHNPHDPCAIAVLTSAGRKLGYLPRRVNVIPARLADAGFALTARVAAIRPAPAPQWQRLTITVEVQRG